ncbi:MAG: hypothetical protein OEX07_15100 [Gammaproteobacteria bacterium]|nr:hypothetical protein [Gammaproteobacteria bacterium]
MLAVIASIVLVTNAQARQNLEILSASAWWYSHDIFDRKDQNYRVCDEANMTQCLLNKPISGLLVEFVIPLPLVDKYFNEEKNIQGPLVEVEICLSDGSFCYTYEQWAGNNSVALDLINTDNLLCKNCFYFRRSQFSSDSKEMLSLLSGQSNIEINLKFSSRNVYHFGKVRWSDIYKIDKISSQIPERLFVKNKAIGAIKIDMGWHELSVQ